MNMILHGIEAPNIRHMNTLADNINDIQEKDRFDIILANPPFGAKIGTELQQNFPIKSSLSDNLFLQHFIKSLKPEGMPASLLKILFFPIRIMPVFRFVNSSWKIVICTRFWIYPVALFREPV